MPDHAWGRAFKKLCELRGVKLGSGKGNPQATKRKEATLASLAQEVGVSERTAKRRLKAAREYNPNKPEVVQGAHGPLCR
jgi:AraC-like DNA-binding protein